MKRNKLIIWLILSSFGIMFAVLSWIQDIAELSILVGYRKGVLALLTGLLLYYFLAKKTMD
ncbi:MAG: hypothetical protein CBC83_06040 [Flavobacteriales bacterium TMED123]|nr:MAG: hypothetical protein CBC83_06040 [Flavobacteriales bacterium TMED123]|tara:strand:+ start:347 stop:529 length:183 start_codon:yes stop_codon:yes gene_type:complete